MRVLRFDEFLNESQKLNEWDQYTWQGKNIFKYEPTPLTPELRDEAIKRFGNKAEAARIDISKSGSNEEKRWIEALEKEAIAFLKSGPYRTINFEYRSSDRPHYEIVPLNPKETGYIGGSFLSVVKGPLGFIEVAWDFKAKNGYLVEYEEERHRMHDSFREYIQSAKVQDFLKKIYLSIPDTRAKDEILMNKGAKKSRKALPHWTSSWQLPVTFTEGFFSDPVIKAKADMDDYIGDEIVEIFQELNKKYYQEWRKLNRKGIKGAFNDLRAWWIGEEEHIEFMNQLNEMNANKIKVGDVLYKGDKEGKVVKVMHDMVNVDFGNGDVYGIMLNRIQGDQISEAMEDYIPGGLADDLSAEDIAKRHSVSVGQIEAQIKKGIKVEMEHTDDDKKAEEIAKDHLMEFPDYYDKLEKIEPQHESLNEGKAIKWKPSKNGKVEGFTSKSFPYPAKGDKWLSRDKLIAKWSKRIQSWLGVEADLTTVEDFWGDYTMDFEFMGSDGVKYRLYQSGEGSKSMTYVVQKYK